MYDKVYLDENEHMRVEGMKESEQEIRELLETAKNPEYRKVV